MADEQEERLIRSLEKVEGKIVVLDLKTDVTFIFPNEDEERDFFVLKDKYAKLRGMYKTMMAGTQFRFKHREDKTAFEKMWKQYEDSNSTNAVFGRDKK